MTWADFYLGCFLVGLALSVVSVMGHIHVPHAHVPAGLGHGPHAHGGDVSPVNFATITAFLAWFGGVGYLLTHYYGVWRWLALGAAIAAGLVGGALVFWFVAKVLWAGDESLDPADYRMVGVLGRVTNPIRAGGTGELVFSQEGTRRTSGARSEDGSAIAKGSEVIVTRYERGIAYVRPWDSATELGDVAKHSKEGGSS